MSQKKSARKKAAETRKRKAAGQKAATTRKHRAAGIKAAEKRKHRAAGKKAATTRIEKKQPAVASAPSPVLPHIPPAIDRTDEELPAPTPETAVTAEETSENPTASLRASIEALRNARWGSK